MIKDADGIRLYSKSGIDWTAKYRPLAAEAEGLAAESFIVEGETMCSTREAFQIFMLCALPSRARRRIST